MPQNDSNNFSPRVGLAWDLKSDGKHVLRAGYGVYFGQTFLNIPLFMIQQINPTLFATVLDLEQHWAGRSERADRAGTNVRLSAYRFGVDTLPSTPAARVNFMVARPEE